jgi:hypothetical protein
VDDAYFEGDTGHDMIGLPKANLLIHKGIHSAY